MFYNKSSRIWCGFTRMKSGPTLQIGGRLRKFHSIVHCADKIILENFD